jgi:hypothetical protein
MKRTEIGILGLLVGVFLLFAGQASADLMSAIGNTTGPVTFNMSGYSSYDPYGTTTGFTDAWGVFSVKEVTAGTKSIWSNTNPNDQIYGMFYGFYPVGGYDNIDGSVTINLGGDGNQVPGFAMYETNYSIDFLKQGPGGRNGLTYSDGTPAKDGDSSVRLLNGDFEYGVTADTYVLAQEKEAGWDEPTTGICTGYASVTGGSLFPQLNAKTIVDPNGIKHAMYFSMDIEKPDTSADEASSGWTQRLEYRVDADPVPEPSTMLLFGTGLLGLAGIGRRLRK